MKIDRTLDLRGYLCPSLEMITGSTLSSMRGGSTLKIVVDDEGALESVIRLCDARDCLVIDKGTSEDRPYCLVRT